MGPLLLMAPAPGGDRKAYANLLFFFGRMYFWRWPRPRGLPPRILFYVLQHTALCVLTADGLLRGLHTCALPWLVFLAFASWSQHVFLALALRDLLCTWSKSHVFIVPLAGTISSFLVILPGCARRDSESPAADSKNKS